MSMAVHNNTKGEKDLPAMFETRGIPTRDNHIYRVIKFTSFDHMDLNDLVRISGRLLKEDGESM